MPDLLATLLLLIGLELVLGIDNVLVISILVSRLPEKLRNKARYIGLLLAMICRIGALFLVVFLAQLTAPLVTIVDHPISVRDLLLLAGGLFLLYKAVHEIHHVVEAKEAHAGDKKSSAKNTFFSIITQIVLLDVVFSLDSVITAVGLTDNTWVIILAVILSFALIMAFAKSIGDFIMRHPALKILALSFLVTIGVTIFLEGLHHKIPKAYIYLPMGFALGVEFLQMRYLQNKQKRSSKK